MALELGVRFRHGASRARTCAGRACATQGQGCCVRGAVGTRHALGHVLGSRLCSARAPTAASRGRWPSAPGLRPSWDSGVAGALPCPGLA